MRKEKYQANLVEKVCFEIFKFHHGQERLYELDTEADELYETIFDKYNGQFNLKYSGECWYFGVLFLH